jgi:hypothetical protein
MDNNININDSTENKIEYPRIEIRGIPIDISIDNKPYGAIVKYAEKGVSKGATMRNLGIDFDNQKLIYEYWDFIADEDGDVVTFDYINYQYPNYSGWNEFYFYQPQSELGVVSSKFGINAIMYHKFDVRCFADNGDFYQPITFDAVVVNESATYNPYYSAEYINDNGGSTSGLENIPDFENADGSATINVVDGEGPYTYLIHNGIDFVVNSDNIFSDLDGDVYNIKVQGSNAAGTSGLVVEQIQEVTILKPIMFGIYTEIDEESPENNKIYVQSTQNNYGLTEYKLDAGEWTTESMFSNVERGEHTVYIKDSNNTTAEKTVFM